MFLSAKACCQFIFIPLSAKTPWSLSTKQQLLSYYVPSCVKFHSISVPHSTSLSRSLWITAVLCGILCSSLRFNVICRLAESVRVTFKSLIKVFSRAGPSVDPYDTLDCYTPLWMESNQLTS